MHIPKTQFARLSLLPLLAAALFNGFTSAAHPADPGWPRVFQKDGKQLTVYQPQVDHWHGYTNLHFRCAIAVKGVLKEEKFGVVEVDALTATDHANRIVAIVPLQRELRFAGTAEPELAALRRAAEQLNPPGQATTLSLDRVIAYLEPAKQPVQHAVELNLDPPKIFSSSTPAILVIFMGEPQFKPVETNRTDLLFALNTNWDVLLDAASRRYYLLNGEGWLTTTNVLKGPWTPAQELPASIFSLPANENWAEARKWLPGKPSKAAPTVFVSTNPAEMILTAGTPSFLPVQGTRLMRVNNTESVLFLHTGDGKYYYLVAGRWFRGGSLNGPWLAASKDLPPDFARIPDSDPASFVKASIPGTREAQDAVLLASIPTTTTVNLTNVTMNVTYSGAPQFVVIQGTTVQYAVNTPNQVFLVNGGYYLCSQGVWFCGKSASGPWTFCTSVPAAIYTIPPSNPNYNVTYVVVQSSTTTTVVYSQTAGYSGAYVSSTGVLMFGAGAAAASTSYYYYYPPLSYYSYGCSATYHYGYGGYYGAGYAAYGPYGGAGYAAGYNPYTGTYARSSYAYGPYGSASRSAAYNPYTGTSAASRSVNTAYGSASQATAYNARTGARASAGQVNSAYGSAGYAGAYNPTTGRGGAAGYKSTAYGSAAGVTTASGASAAGVTTAGGGSAATWNTQQGQGSVAKTQSGNVYASNGDTVYKQTANGNWVQNSGSGWESTAKSQSASSSASANRQAEASSYQQQAQARQSGNQQAARTSQFQSSGSGYSGSRSSGGSRSGGGRR